MFGHCRSLVEIKLNEGLRVIDNNAFLYCEALRKVTLPSTVMELGIGAFYCCRSLVEVQLNEGLKIIGERAFQHCVLLRSVTIPSTVTELGLGVFYNCTNLSEVILLGGARLLDQEFLVRVAFSEEQGLLNQDALDEIILSNRRGCPLLAAVKISISWALSERMARLLPKCRVSVEEKIRTLPRLELMQNGNVFACFPVVSRAEGGDDKLKVHDTNLETARSLYRILQLIAFHELKESGILVELAMWKSSIDGDTVESRVDCRVPIPDPAKVLIMEYCGFAGFLEPAIEGA